jgi:hypothetical protein
MTVWTSVEESTLRVGIPGTGKSAELACRIIDAPGAVVVTSTATDLYELTEPLRWRRGPVWVFNPGGIGGLASTLRWSPLVGCKDPHTAARRAIDLMGPTRAGTEGERWDIQGRRVLGVFLHAAALGGYRMRDVQAWVANPDAGRSAILTALDKSPQAIEMRQAAEHAITVTPKTRDGVMLAIAPAVSWVTNPAAVEAGDASGLGLFDVARFVDEAATLYLLGDDDGTVGPLVGGLDGGDRVPVAADRCDVAGWSAGPGADVRAGRDRARLPGAAGSVDGRAAEAVDHHSRGVPGSWAVAAAVGRRRRVDDPELGRRGAGVRRREGCRRPGAVRPARRRARRGDRDPGRERRCDVDEYAAGAGDLGGAPGELKNHRALLIGAGCRLRWLGRRSRGSGGMSGRRWRPIDGAQDAWTSERVDQVDAVDDMGVAA